MNNTVLFITVFLVIIIALFIGCNKTQNSNSSQRDYNRFPSDENGDVLYNLFLQGMDLNTTKDVEYAIIFPDNNGAIKFADSCKSIGLSIYIEEYEGQTDFKYGVIATKSMLPTHSNITALETELGNKAKYFGGINDGWGFFTQK